MSTWNIVCLLFMLSYLSLAGWNVLLSLSYGKGGKKIWKGGFVGA